MLDIAPYAQVLRLLEFSRGFEAAQQVASHQRLLEFSRGFEASQQVASQQRLLELSRGFEASQQGGPGRIVGLPKVVQRLCKSN